MKKSFSATPLRSQKRSERGFARKKVKQRKKRRVEVKVARPVEAQMGWSRGD